MTYEDFLAERKQLLERIKKLEAENAEDWGWLSKGKREVEAATGGLF